MIRFVGFPVCVLTLCLLVSPFSQNVFAEENKKPDPVTFFYKNPDLQKVPEIIRILETQGVMENKSSRPGIIGFLAGLFVKYPEMVDQWIKHDYRRATDFTIINSLGFSGMQVKIPLIAGRNGWSDEDMAAFEEFPALDTLLADTPENQDILWGASFATGDAAYANNMIDTIGKRLQVDWFQPNDLIVASQTNRDQYQKAQAALIQKHGKRKFVELVVHGTALWSLSNNAKRHNFIANAVSARIRKEGGSDLGYVLQRRLFQELAPVVANISGKTLDILLSGTTRDGIAKDIQEDIKNPDNNAMKAFTNIFEKNDPVHIVELMFARKPAKGECLFEVIAPNGSRFSFGPFSMSVDPSSIDGGVGLLVHSTEIDQKQLTQEGVYSLKATCDGGPGDNLIVPWNFFVAKR